MTNERVCPICGNNLDYDEVDIGVGVQTGNYRCEGCGWQPDNDTVDERVEKLGKFEDEL